jgi:hypothetical protein
MLANVALTQKDAAADMNAPAWMQISRSPFLNFSTVDGDTVSAWRAAVLNSSRQLPELERAEDLSNFLVDRLRALRRVSRTWTIILCSGGHFAGAVFEAPDPSLRELPAPATAQRKSAALRYDTNVVAHRSFHRYTVRRKQGGSQAARDSQGGKPKSAGASLRRYNETAMAKDVKDTMEAWKPFLDKSDAIFLYAPSLNKRFFFGEGADAGPLAKGESCAFFNFFFFFFAKEIFFSGMLTFPSA